MADLVERLRAMAGSDMVPMEVTMKLLLEAADTIEALRVRADAMAGEAIKHEARAERLAEALRDAAEALQVAGLPGNAKQFRSMLRGHDQRGVE